MLAAESNERSSSLSLTCPLKVGRSPRHRKLRAASNSTYPRNRTPIHAPAPKSATTTPAKRFRITHSTSESVAPRPQTPYSRRAVLRGVKPRSSKRWWMWPRSPLKIGSLRRKRRRMERPTSSRGSANAIAGAATPSMVADFWLQMTA